jgi:hypothetical protein
MDFLAQSYAALGRTADALKVHEEVLALCKGKLGPDHTDTFRTMSSLAWFLATASDPKLRDRPRAVELAAKAAELSPMEPNYRGTSGMARYRTGDWKGALADLEKAIDLCGTDNANSSSNGVFLAIVYWRLGEKDLLRHSLLPEPMPVGEVANTVRGLKVKSSESDRANGRRLAATSAAKIPMPPRPAPCKSTGLSSRPRIRSL